LPTISACSSSSILLTLMIMSMHLTA